MRRLLSHAITALALLYVGCVDDRVSPAPPPGGDPTGSDETVGTDETSQVSDCETALAAPVAFAFGAPLRGLTADQLARFDAGADEFAEEETPETGLGPVFNEVSCATCHVQGAIGGAGPVVETRFGLARADGTFDPLAQFGGSLMQSHGISKADCTQPPESVPAEANVVAGRQTTALFGLGLLDAVSERLLHFLADPADRNGDGISGRVNVVVSPATGRPAVGRFGWKAQVPSVFVFAGDAYLNEMGITNTLFPVENAPQGGAAVCDDGIPAPALDDPDDDGNGTSDDVDAFADFMRFLAPPPVAGVATPAVFRGARQFVALRCAACHQPSLITHEVRGVPALSRKLFFPFTDLLLHDMGGLGDGIEQGRAGGREMRTAPLWGLRVSPPYLHDGRAATITDAILAHDGEAARSREAFSRLTAQQRADLLAFLGFI